MPGPTGGAPSAPPDPLAVFDGRGGAPGKRRRMGRGNGRGKRKGKGKGGAITMTIWRNDRAQLADIMNTFISGKIVVC